MAKITAIIDLGSNGIRMAIYEKTSRFGFYILHEEKIKFRLLHGACENKNLITDKQINKAVQIIQYFKNTAQHFKCNKIFCIGTSAIRDANNKNTLIELLKSKLNIHIKIIDGNKEAYLSSFGAINLLPHINNATCIDIGGGSVELSKIENNKIIKTLSLDLGTVRLKDMFKDKANKLDKYIDSVIDKIELDFKSKNLICIGGSLRAISNSIMQKNLYPISQVHGFCYKLKDEKQHIVDLINCKNNDLASFNIKKDRHDTIKQGANVFLKIAEKLNVEQIITSGAGVREGIYIKDLFRKHSSFPNNFNPSLKSLEDRFSKSINNTIAYNSNLIFDELKEIHFVNEKYKKELIYASKLINIGLHLSYYSKHKHSAYCVLSGLNFCIKHEEKALIATIIELHGKKFNFQNLKLKKLLPDENTLAWLNFILEFSKIISNFNEKCQFKFKGKALYIYKKTSNFILHENIKKISKPKSFNIFINDEEI